MRQTPQAGFVCARDGHGYRTSQGSETHRGIRRDDEKLPGGGSSSANINRRDAANHGGGAQRNASWKKEQDRK